MTTETGTDTARQTEYQIREFEAEDQAAIQDLFRRTHETALGALPPALQAQMAVAIDQEVAKNLSDVAGRYAAYPNECYVVAGPDGQLAGFAALIARNRDTAELKNVVVDDRQQGKGLGRMLLEHFEDRARLRGHRRAVLWTFGHLRTALGMYQRRGWTDIPLYDHTQNPELEPLALELKLR